MRRLFGLTEGLHDLFSPPKIVFSILRRTKAVGKRKIRAIPSGSGETEGIVMGKRACYTVV